MNTILLLAVVGLIVGIILLRLNDPYSLKREYIGAGIVGSLAGCLLGVFVAGLLGTINTSYTMVKVNTLPLVALQDGTSSRWYVGAGSYKGQAQYSYYAQVAPNTYERTVITDGYRTIHVKELPDAKPSVSFWKADYKWKDWILLPESHTYVEFNVPLNSIKQDINLDNK